jgi:hypothetical protein
LTTATTRQTTWQPPTSVPRDELVRISAEMLARPDRPIEVRENLFRINTLGMDWDIGGEIFQPTDPAQLARDPAGRKIGFFSLHGGAGDHRTRRTAARFLAAKLGYTVVTMTFPGKLNLRDPNRDWSGETIRPDGTTRTPLWQVDEEITPDQYELIQDATDPIKRAKWGTLFFIKAKEGTRFYDRMAAWPIAFEEAMVEMCHRFLPASEGYAILAHGQSTGGPFVHQTLQRVDNVIGLAGLETSQWGAVGATRRNWDFPFNYLTIRTWRHIAKYLGPEAGKAGADRLPWLMEDVFAAWEKAKVQPQFKAEYEVTFNVVPALEASARVTATRLGLSSDETAALIKRYLNLPRPLSGPGVKPVPPLLYQIAAGSVDHKIENYRGVLFVSLAKLDPAPRVHGLVLEAGLHANETPEEGLPQGVFPVAARIWEDAVNNGYYSSR